MDEADLLGDRIAIMGDGHLRCMGSSLFLKERFGVGYQLVIEKRIVTSRSDSGAADAEKLEKMSIDLVKKHVPTAKLVSSVGAEMVLQLPLESASKPAYT